MNVQSAVIEILKQAGKPLHAKDIAEQIITSGLWKSDGKTPDATVSACLYSNIKNEGNKSPFVQIAPQTFALRENPTIKSTPAKTVGHCEITATQRSVSTITHFSFADCAQKVLEEFSDKKPMHYKEITDKALAKGWLITSGKTPEATMHAQLGNEIRLQQKRGKRPRFVQLGRGYIGLSNWNGHDLNSQIEQQNSQVKKALLERLLTMQPQDFEELIGKLLSEMDFAVEVTRPSGDGGIDVRGTLIVGDAIRIKMAVQAKKWKLKNNIHSPVVQQVRGSLGAHEQGLIITTSDFSSGAIKEATQVDKTPIALMNGEQLVALLMEYEIGVHRSTPNLFEIDEEFACGTPIL